jgi:hypothetical protein
VLHNDANFGIGTLGPGCACTIVELMDRAPLPLEKSKSMRAASISAKRNRDQP